MSISKALSSICLSLVSAGFIALPAMGQAADCTHSALVKGQGAYNIVLENNCSAPVKWSYNACALGQSLETGIVTVGPGQTFQTRFEYDLLGTPQLLEESCEGVCLNGLLSCSVSSALQPSSEPLQDPSVLFPKTAKPAEPQPQLKPLSELMVEKKPASTDIYDSLMDGIEPETEPEPVLRPIDELLAEKPAPAQPKPIITPAEGVKPKINAQTLPSNIGVKPVAVPPAEPQPPKGAEYVAACVTTEVKDRNFRGQGKLELVNHCQYPQNVAVRVCIAGQTDTQEILTIKSEGKSSVSYPQPKNVTPRVRIASCQGANCRPATPRSCN